MRVRFPLLALLFEIIFAMQKIDRIGNRKRHPTPMGAGHVFLIRIQLLYEQVNIYNEIYDRYFSDLKFRVICRLYFVVLCYGCVKREYTVISMSLL